MFTLNKGFMKGYGSITGGFFKNRISNTEDETATLREDFIVVAKDMSDVFIKESKKINLAHEENPQKDK